MAKPYSQELRQAIITSVGNGCTLEQVAKDYEVSLSSVKRFHRRWRETGNVRPEKFGVQGFPTLIVIDPQGKVHDIHVGYTPTLREDVGRQIKALLEKK